MNKLIKLFLGYYVFKKLALGYIDPNTGGMLFQFLAVIFALLSTAFLFFSGQIKAFFARFRRSVREQRGEGEQNVGGELDNTREDSLDTEI